jgi:predicted enzyme related to lactoylglutathione lyase
MAEATAVKNKPAWVDLSARDPAAARDFYTALFGWTVEEISDPDGYGLFKREGKEVGGISPLRDMQQPTAWTMHVLVDSVDAAVQRVQKEGGTVRFQPTDIRGQGRVAVVEDPSGAVFGLWQPLRHQGWDVAGEPGTACWFELQSLDLEPAKDFYAHVFDWKSTKLELPSQGYTTFGYHDNDAFAGGMQRPTARPQHLASFWQPYFAVSDLDEMAARAENLGATVLTPPQEAENVGRWVVLQDPQTAMFGLLRPSRRGPAP